MAERSLRHDDRTNSTDRVDERLGHGGTHEFVVGSQKRVYAQRQSKGTLGLGHDTHDFSHSREVGARRDIKRALRPNGDAARLDESGLGDHCLRAGR